MCDVTAMSHVSAMVCQPTLVGKLVDRLVGRLVGRLGGRLVGRLVGWLVGNIGRASQK